MCIFLHNFVTMSTGLKGGGHVPDHLSLIENHIARKSQESLWKDWLKQNL